MKQNYSISKNYNINDIRSEVIEDRKILQDLGYKEMRWKKYIINFVDSSFFAGRTIKLTKHFYWLTFNKEYLTNVPANVAHAVVMHEVLHSLNNGYSHEGKWQEGAQKVMTNYIFSKITEFVHPTSYYQTHTVE